MRVYLLKSCLSLSLKNRRWKAQFVCKGKFSSLSFMSFNPIVFQVLGIICCSCRCKRLATQKANEFPISIQVKNAKIMLEYRHMRFEFTYPTDNSIFAGRYKDMDFSSTLTIQSWTEADKRREETLTGRKQKIMRKWQISFMFFHS